MPGGPLVFLPHVHQHGFLVGHTFLHHVEGIGGVIGGACRTRGGHDRRSIQLNRGISRSPCPPPGVGCRDDPTPRRSVYSFFRGRCNLAADRWISLVDASQDGTTDGDREEGDNRRLGYQVLNAAEPVVVDLYADWCGPCRALAPLLDRFASTTAGRSTFVKVNVDDEPQVASYYDVASIPTLLVFGPRGQIVHRSSGMPIHRGSLRCSTESLDTPSAANQLFADKHYSRVRRNQCPRLYKPSVLLVAPLTA